MSQSGEPDNATKPTIHPKNYQKGMALLFVLGTVLVLFAFLYFIPD